MNAKLIIIITFACLYGIFEMFMSVRQRWKKNIAASGDKGSIWVLYISITLGYLLSFNIGATTIGRIYHWDTFFAIGMMLAVIGLAIRIASIIILKQHFTYTVTTIDKHELIKTGLYKFIRHPGYLGQLLIFVGMAASLSNWLSVIFMVVPTIVGYSYRIKIEETFMAEQLGEEYLEYQKRTKKLIPAIY